MKSSLNSSDDQKPNQSTHHDALSGWGALGGIAIGALIGLFFHKVLVLAIGLGVTGWLAGALIDRSRE